MFEYIDPNGNALPENEVIKLALQKGLTSDEYVKKNKLTLRPKQKKAEVKKETEKVVEKPEIKLSKSGIDKAFGETEIEDPLGIKKMTSRDSNADAVLKNIQKWEKKPKLVGPIEKEYEPVLIKKDKIGDYLTSSLRTEKAIETAFATEEEEGADFLKKLYAGIPNLTFEETTSFGGDISNVFDAVKAVYTDPITGKKIESETLEFDVNALNASKKERPQIANKNADILKDFFNKNLKTEDLSKNKYLQDITKLNYNKQVAKAITPEFRAKVDEEFETPDLFATVKETYRGTSAGGGFTMGTAGGGSYTIKPYEKELNDAKRQILKETPKISKEELQIEAERFTRDLLKTKAINDKKALVAEEIIGKDPSMQANLYVGSLLAKKEAVDIQNKSSVKLKIAETKAININSLATESVDIFNGVPKSEAELAAMVRKFENVGIIFDPLDSEIVTLKNGQQVNKGFLNAYSKLKEQYKINNVYAASAFKDQQDNLQQLEDSDIFATAAAKNYDLSEKYLTNVGIGFSDLAVGGAYFTAKVLDIATPFSYAGDAVSKMIYGKEAETASERLDKWAVNYTNAAADIRNSYTRDVSFDEAFSDGSKFGKFAVQEITSQIPILVAMVASGGAATAVAGVTSAGTKMADMQTEMASGEASYSKTELWLKSIGYGGAEAGFSALTTIPILKRAKISFGKTVGQDVIDNSMKAYFKEKTPGFVFDQFLESSGEVGTQMTQNIIDGRPTMENTAHAGFSGFAMGTVISGVPYTKGLYLSAFSDYNSKEGIRNLEKDFNDLGKKFEASTNPEEKKALGSLMDEKAAERDLAIEKQQKLINNNLRAGVAQSIISIEGKKAKLQNRAKEVLDDKNIKPENKELIIKNLRKEFDKFENAKQKALDPSNMMQDLSQFKVLEIDNPDRYNDLIDRAKTQIGADMTVKPDDDKVQKAAYDLYLNQEIDINIENAGKVEGAKITSFETKKETIDYIKANNALSDADKAEAIYEITNGADGFNAANVGQVLVKENMFANQRTQIATHEVGHYVTDLLLKNNPEAFVPIANQLLLTTKKLDGALYKKLLEATERDAKGNLKATEVVSRFLELVSKGDISFAEKSKKYKGLAGLFGSMVQKTYPDVTAFDFKGETDMYNFVVGLGKKISAGTLTMSDIAAGSESGAVKLAGSLAVDKKYTGIVSGAETEVGFSKAKVDEIQKKIDNLEDQLDTDEIDYDTYENRLKIFSEELKKAKLEPEVEKPKVEKPKVAVTEEEVVREIIKNEKGTIASDKVQRIYDERGEQGANEIIKLFKPITAKIVAKRRDAPGFNEEELTKEIELGAGGLFDLIRKYNASKGVPLAAYINKNLPLRAITASRRVLDKDFTSDVSTEVNVMATETADQNMTERVAEKPKYKDAIDSNILEPKVLETLTNKIISTVRLLKSRIDAPVTLNRTVTPLIAEIRDDIGKQLDIDIKTMLGGKKDGVLKKELLKAKRYILENMTTTWLMGKDGQGGIPQAIQKRVDGKWVNFPNWVGQKIDREAMSTDLAGRTSGAELVRRLPNVFNNVSNEEFLAQIIGPDGNPIRGRKESVSKAMAEEIAFDITKRDLEEEGPIYDALKVNQERLGVEIKESLKAEFNKQADRGNIKFSKATNKSKGLFLLEEGGWDRNYPEYRDFYNTLATNEKRSLTWFLNRAKNLVDKYNEIWNKNLGVKYEKDTYLKLRKDLKAHLKDSGLKLEESVPDRFNSIKPDLVFINEQSGDNVIVELKSNVRDYVGSSSNGNFINDNSTFTKNFSGIKELNIAQKENEGRTELINYLKQLIKEGSKDVRITENGIQISKDLYGKLDRSKASTKNVSIPIKAISDINLGKDVLQIQDTGAFAFPGSKASGIGLFPELTGTMRVTTDFRTNSAGKGWRTLIERAYFTLDPNFKQPTNVNFGTNPIDFIDRIKGSKVNNNITNANAVANSFKLSKAPKGISVFDFDDTIGITKGSVLYTMPDGSNGKLNAEEFAKYGGSFLDSGAIFDFSEFSKVVGGKPGPMVTKMKKMIAKFGPENFFILTARPANAAGPIHEFLASIDINIPLENITGLGNSTAQAKADWMVKKAADGYNDFYFSDDAIQNVTAVKNALDVLDVKSKIQQARLKFSKTISPEFNRILEENVGVKADEKFSAVAAKRKGAAIGKYRFFVPPSAADLELLTYDFLGSGTTGERQQEFFNKALFEPYSNGIALIDAAKQSIKNDYKALLKAFPAVSRELGKLTPDKAFTYDQALRVSMWNSMGEEIPGLLPAEITKLSDFVNQDPELSAFRDGLVATGRQGNGWTKPSEYWDSETIVSDLHNITEKLGRKKYLAEFVQNSEEMFSKENLNKIETIYGSNFRDALEDSIYSMTNGTNREAGSGRINAAWLNWINNSTGAIMFLNTRSAILQTIGSINYLNWRDNNPLNAGIAFANQPQYWKDFSYIWNSDKMKERRSGLKEDVSSAEIANAASGSTSKANAVISYLLKKGFMPTQIGDSFAIASGGAAFYRNRINYNLKQGMSQTEAEAEAWKDFIKVTDQTQQSGDPRDISQQQRSAAGRLVLAFQNTSMQQARLVKKAGLDLINGRGDAKTNISKIVYYTAVQNIIFGSLQSALFATLFSDDDDEDEAKKKKNKTMEERYIDIGNGIVDTILRGSGMAGAIVATLKNVYLKYHEESEKGFKADYAKVLTEAANIAPPVGSKFVKLMGAMKTTAFEKDVIAKRGWSVMQDGRVNLSPSYSVAGQAVEAVTNLPMNRFVTKIKNLSEAMDSRNKSWQRIAMVVGYNPYSVGAKDEEGDIIKAEGKVARKVAGIQKMKETRTMTRDSLNRLSPEDFKAYVLKKKTERLAVKDSINSLPKEKLAKYLKEQEASKSFTEKQKEVLEEIKRDSIGNLSTTEYFKYLDAVENKKEIDKINRKFEKFKKEQKRNIYK